jgi:pyruvate dehydrogenase E1 component beta subunit
VRNFGVGAEIAARIGEEHGVFAQRVGASFTPVPYSPPLEAAYLPDATKIREAVSASLEFARTRAS